ncbi:hypothetical protein [Actinomadura craniellae]|uniref:hypothetical protein n=1 Tax=Actinomadura craniellae TaxID=2231787 RepID=UPI001F2423BA|nr:hypothetical protein [Actinomadura craniellae]
MAEIEARVGARGFSSFVDTAAERYLALLKAQEIVEDFERRNGPVPAEETDAAERAWRGEQPDTCRPATPA